MSMLNNYRRGGEATCFLRTDIHYACKYVCFCVYTYIQGVSGGIVNVIGGGSMDSSE